MPGWGPNFILLLLLNNGERQRAPIFVYFMYMDMAQAQSLMHRAWSVEPKALCFALACPWLCFGLALAWLCLGLALAWPWLCVGLALAWPWPWLGLGLALALPWLGLGLALSLAWPWLGLCFVSALA